MRARIRSGLSGYRNGNRNAGSLFVKQSIFLNEAEEEKKNKGQLGPQRSVVRVPAGAAKWRSFIARSICLRCITVLLNLFRRSG